ncbi:uncharacterized protein [Paramisgurnus dabryanus]|uniref:uncharacterized protein n=1 Tax=Paramisgurnus dabryanus TaxID=90735 RepID=UPI0031F36E13
MDNLTFTNSILLVEGLKVTPQSSYPVFILLLLVYIFAMGCNIILIILISTQKNLHHPMHFLFCNLPLNDILGTTVILPRLLQDILTEASERYMTYVECVVQAYFVHIFAAASILLVSILLGLTIRLSRCRYTIENPFCDNASLFKLSCENVSVNNVFGLIYSVFIFTLSLGSVFITYFKIATVCISSKNKALNSKAIKTCSTHIAVYLIMFVSCATMIFLHRVPEYSDSRKLASIMFHIVPPGLNPLVYGLQTKEIREKIVQLVWYFWNCELEERRGQSRLGVTVLISPDVQEASGKACAKTFYYTRSVSTSTYWLQCSYREEEGATVSRDKAKELPFPCLPLPLSGVLAPGSLSPPCKIQLEGLLNCEPVKIELTEEALPYSVNTPCRDPFPLLPKVTKELKRMLSLNIIEEVTEPTDWPTMLPAPKGNKDNVRVLANSNGPQLPKIDNLHHPNGPVQLHTSVICVRSQAQQGQVSLWKELQFFGQIIRVEGVKPDESKVEAIAPTWSSYGRCSDWLTILEIPAGPVYSVASTH